MSAVDEAFVGAGQKPGLEVWRVEKLKIILQDCHTHGEFYTGDSYIVMHTKKPPGSDKFEWNIHFWLGHDTSQDEQGVAAYKTVELDDSLGGAPVQHREVQDHESKLFLSYFKNGIKYLSGGIDSGFKKIERGKYDKRLFHIKGKRDVRARQVKCHFTSLNQGDVFLLDCGLTLHLWIGPNSSMFERMKGIEISNKIRDEERGGRAQIRIIDNRWNTDSQFFKDLGSEGPISEACHGGDDAEFEKKLRVDVKLYRVSDASGELVVTEVAKRPLHHQDLDTKDCFILDSGPSGIFVWVGKDCTKNEKKSAWSHATSFLQYKGYPDWTKVTRVVEDGETPVFKQYFSSWKEKDEQIGLGRRHTFGNIAKVDSSKVIINYNEMHKKKYEKEVEMPDDGNGEIEVWKVQNNDLVPVDADTIGAFSSRASYVMLYTYRPRNKPRYIVYYWQGSRSSTEDKAASAIFAKKLDDEELAGEAQQIRVIQGREPEHLLYIFKGKMIVFMGDEDSDSTSISTQMFHVRGTNERNSRAVEVFPSASSLNSNDVFFIIGEYDTYLWVGKMSETMEFETARKLIDYFTPDRSLILTKEEEEPVEFWELLGGKGVYAKSQNKDKKIYSNYPRFFVCSNTSGRFSVEEIQNFSQEDLLEGDVIIFDTFDQIFVWVGWQSNNAERKEGLRAALTEISDEELVERDDGYTEEFHYNQEVEQDKQEEQDDVLEFDETKYLQADPHGRTEKNTPLLQIKQGLEPPNFTSHFHGWNSSLWKRFEQTSSPSNENVEQVFQTQDQSNVTEVTTRFEQTSSPSNENVEVMQTQNQNNVTEVTEELEKYDKTYPYKELVRKRPPVGVDVTCKEKYLSDEEFFQVFGMSKDGFYSLPKWKQVNQKKKVELF